jgi:hypothetical protein
MNARVINSCRLSVALTTSISMALLAGCGSTGSKAGSGEAEESGNEGSGSTSTGGQGGGTGQGSGSQGGTSGATAASGSGSFGGGGTGTTVGSGTTQGASGSGSGAATGSTGGGTGSGAGASGTVSSGAFTGGAQAVTQAGGDIYHRGTFTEPGLTKTAVATMLPDTTFNTNATFSGNGSSQNQGTPSVLYLENGPTAAGCPTGATGCTATARTAGAGLFFGFGALGSTPNITAFDETTGLPVWTGHVTAGGDGIRGTPVIDAANRLLYIASGPGPHQLHAVSVDTGVEVTTGGWPATIGPFTGNNDGDENQHGALILLNGVVYVPFGGHYGDGGNYNGWVFAIDTTNPANVHGWTTQSSRSGIWGAGGLASDGQTSVFAVTGDTSGVARNASDSQEVVRITGMGTFTRSAANVFVARRVAGLGPSRGRSRFRRFHAGLRSASGRVDPGGAPRGPGQGRAPLYPRRHQPQLGDLRREPDARGAVGRHSGVQHRRRICVYVPDHLHLGVGSPRHDQRRSGRRQLPRRKRRRRGHRLDAHPARQDTDLPTGVVRGRCGRRRPHELPADFDDQRRRERQRGGLVHRRVAATGRRWRHGSEASHHGRRALQRRAEHELPHWSQESHRRLGPRASLLLVARRNLSEANEAS